MSTSRKQALLTSLLGGAAMVVVLYLIGFSGSDTSVPAAAGDQPAPRDTAPPSPDDARPSSPTRAPADELEDPAGEPRPPEPPKARELRRSLQHKLGRPSDAQAGEHQPPAEPPPSWSVLPEEYVAGILREQLAPLAQACYEDIASPGTAGEMTMTVVVLGDAEVGGAIERVDIADVDPSIEGDLTECIRQAAYELEFDPPEEGQGAQEFQLRMRMWSEELPKQPA